MSVITVPKPKKIRVNVKDEVEYIALARKLDTSVPHEYKFRAFLSVLQKLEIPVYPKEKVSRYMDALAERTDGGEVVCLNAEGYKFLPLRALRYMDSIEREMPGVSICFYVLALWHGDDPFLLASVEKRIKTKRCWAEQKWLECDECVVIDHWDEPEFKLIER